MHPNSFILSRGIFRFSNTHLTNSQIMHKITKNIEPNGFQIASTTFLEHPNAAVVKLNGTIPKRSLRAKLFQPITKFSVPAHHTLVLSVKLSDLERQHNLHQLNYIITCDDIRLLSQFTYLNRSADRLTRNLIKSTKAIESLETMENRVLYPYTIAPA